MSRLGFFVFFGSVSFSWVFSQNISSFNRGFKLDVHLRVLESEVISEEDFIGNSGQSIVLMLPSLGSKQIELEKFVSVPMAFHSFGEVEVSKASQYSKAGIVLDALEIILDSKLYFAAVVAPDVVIGLIKYSIYTSKSKRPSLKSVDTIGFGIGSELGKKFKYAGDASYNVIFGSLLTVTNFHVRLGINTFTSLVCKDIYVICFRRSTVSTRIFPSSHSRSCLCPLSWVNTFSPRSPLSAILNVRFWSSCSTISSRTIHRVNVWIAHLSTLTPSQLTSEDPFSLMENQKLRLNDIAIVSWFQFQLATPQWMCGLSRPKFSQLGLPATSSGLNSDMYISFKERASLFSSQWERSLPPPSSILERTLSSSSLFFFMEEPLNAQSQGFLYVGDRLLAAIETQILTNSIKRFEFNLWSDSLTYVMLNISDKTYVDIYGISQDSRVLKKCVISICLFHFYIYFRLIVRILGIWFISLIYCCISEI